MRLAYNKQNCETGPAYPDMDVVLTGEELANIEFKPVHGLKGVKIASVTLKDAKYDKEVTINLAVVHDMARNIKPIVDDVLAGKSPYHFIEVMNCSAGCINGGGLADLKWFTVLGGYLQKLILRKKVSLPPMGKYNSGQKLFGIFVLIGGSLLILSGWLLCGFPHAMPRYFVALMGDVHLIAGIVLTLFLCVHLFLGVYMFDDFKAMILHGKIPYEEAREMSPLWVQKEVIPISENKC